MSDASVTRLIIRRPDDWHVHLRDGEMMRSVVGYTARQFGRAIVMPNLSPPVTTVAEAEAYRERILAALDPGRASFEPLMTCYLTDETDPAEVERGFRSNVFCACKLYPAHATTNSEHGVTDVRRIRRVLERMERIGMPLLVHGEVTDPAVDVFDREAVFIERVFSELVSDFPELKAVFEHVTTAEAVAFVEGQGANVAATITPHHLRINRNAVFEGGIRPHFYCLPIAKREKHRLALRRAATSGSPKYFLGTDSAPHPVGKKEAACGCAGIFNAPFAMESYATTFEEDGALDRLEAFASEHGPRFYGRQPNIERVVLERTSTEAPERLDASAEELVPFHAGEVLPWRFAGILDEPHAGATHPRRDSQDSRKRSGAA